MTNNVLDLIISGYYSDWFFNVFMTNVTLAVKNNLAILIVFSYCFYKFSKWTKWKWDDTLSLWLRNKITKQNKKDNGGVAPIKPKQEGDK